VTFGYRGRFGFAAGENEDVAAITGQVYNRRQPHQLCADDQTVQIKRAASQGALRNVKKNQAFPCLIS
jgi:hypothetical protein